MKKNMSQSGTHDNDAWNFVEVAMNGFSGFTKAAVYYFYMRCEAVPDVDAVFQPFLDASLKGSSVKLNDDSSLSSSSRPSTAKKRKKNDDAIETLLEQSTAIVDMLKESREAAAQLVKASVEQQNLNQRIENCQGIG